MPEAKVYPTRLRIELEAAASMDLQDLATEMRFQANELPGLKHRAESSRMAIAFEAGRRCGVQQAIETAVI